MSFLKDTEPQITNSTYLFYFYSLFEKKKEMEGDLPSTAPLPRCLQQPRLSQAKVRNLELNPGLPHGWEGLMYLSHHFLPPRVCMSGKLD